MGWLSKLFKGCKHEGLSHKYNEEDESSNNKASSEDGSAEYDVGETDRAAYHSSLNDGCRWNDDVTDHDYHHHNNINDNCIEVHHWGYNHEEQCKTTPYPMEAEHPSLASRQHYHIDSPFDSGNTFQLDPWLFPGCSLFPVCQNRINDGLPNSSSDWIREHCHHRHESYIPNSTYEELQDLLSKNSTGQTLRCYICKIPLQIGVDGRLLSRKHPFWQQNYCPSHDHDGTPGCYSCKRLMTRDSHPLSLKDGRKICNDCQGIFITMTTEDCQPLIREIQQLYEDLEMKVERHFPICLADKTEIDKKNEDSAIFCSGTLGITWGNCNYFLIEVNTPKVGQTGEIDKIDKKQLKLVGNLQVTVIRALYGLPRIFTGSILAHEMMHAWLYQEGHHVAMELEVYEGTCQLMSYIWLQSKVNSLLKSSFEWKLGKFLMYDIEEREDVYGTGFRKAKELLDRYSLKETLKIIQFTGCFFVDFAQ